MRSKSSVSGSAAANFNPLFWEFGLAPNAVVTGMDMFDSAKESWMDWFSMMLRICNTDSVQQIAQALFFLAGIAQAQSKNPRNSLRTLRRKIALLQSHFMKQKPRCWESPIVSYCGTWSTCFWRYALNLQCYSLDGQILHITYCLNILWHHGLFVEHPNSFSIAQWLHIIVKTRLSKWIDDMHAMNRDASTNFIASCPWSKQLSSWGVVQENGTQN